MDTDIIRALVDAADKVERAAEVILDAAERRGHPPLEHMTPDEAEAFHALCVTEEALRKVLGRQP